MRVSYIASALATLVSSVSSLGTSCSAALGAGTAAAGDPFWLQTIEHNGLSSYNANPSSYQVFRNVKDFGAVGDGVTDDTDAINAAISAGTRCGQGCQSSTLTPAVVFFPSGTYLVSKPVTLLYYTQLIGDARDPPTILAAAGFTGVTLTAVLDADPYIDGGAGAQFYINQNNFFRSVRNFIIDITRIPATVPAAAIHWQVSQATSLQNIVFQMSTAADTAHQGIWQENGSGGFMGDLVFNGGRYGMWVGNQQFTVRNVTINNAQVAIHAEWNWGWTFQNLNINNCGIGIEMTTGGNEDQQTVGGEAIIDANVVNTPVFVQTSVASNGQLNGAIVLNNVKLDNVPTAVGVAGGAVVLAGTTGTTTIESWGQGNVYTGSSGTGKFVQDNIAKATKAPSFLDSSGKIFGRGRPQYESYALSQIVSVKAEGAKGDGTSDDTAALQAVFDKYAGCKIIFFPAGTYIVTSTLDIPVGSRIVGEAWSTLAGKGAAFQDQNDPTVVFRVGKEGDSGVLEISDMIFTTVGPAGGAIVMEWNVAQSSQGSAGMWDTHLRIGGAVGTGLTVAECPSSGTGGTDGCMAAFLALHLTENSSAYLEGTWVWLSDHDMESPTNPQAQISIFSGRGLLSESKGPVWMIGTGSEHHVQYQYYLNGAENHYMGLIQTETPYYQPAIVPPAPFKVDSAFSDPTDWEGITSAWGLIVKESSNILIFGAGLYSFYDSYTQDCLNTTVCQNQMATIDETSEVQIYHLSTVGSKFQLSINQEPIIAESSNENMFASTLTSWTRS
ncbi:hypothetical protein MKEN_00446800 [Mycena kentingensis (nom. inval.)]|nr:hypothetical protein MKEN_00446800 [Mycena kentingensis (nom. inval.)]